MLRQAAVGNGRTERFASDWVTGVPTLTEALDQALDKLHYSLVSTTDHDEFASPVRSTSRQLRRIARCGKDG